MNIYFLSDCPVQAAKDLAITHRYDAAREVGQMMSTAARLHGFEGGYPVAYEDHSMTKWVGRSRLHYGWCLEYVFALDQEMQETDDAYRAAYASPTPFTKQLLWTFALGEKYIPQGRWRNPPRCLPDAFKLDYKEWRKLVDAGEDNSSHVLSYRSYYANVKAKDFWLREWADCQRPSWFGRAQFVEVDVA